MDDTIKDSDEKEMEPYKSIFFIDENNCLIRKRLELSGDPACVDGHMEIVKTKFSVKFPEEFAELFKKYVGHLRLQ